MKRLLAYTSISHMGFVLLALYAGNILTFQGLMIMMLAHGLSSAALFIMCGQIYERLHTRDMRLMGGIRGQFQYLAFFLMFFVAALVGIPGLGNFIGDSQSIIRHAERRAEAALCKSVKRFECARNCYSFSLRAWPDLAWPLPANLP
jgi:NADH:ubiquinone oxidoreductase subunit 4 (subunit M)